MKNTTEPTEEQIITILNEIPKLKQEKKELQDQIKAIDGKLAKMQVLYREYGNKIVGIQHPEYKAPAKSAPQRNRFTEDEIATIKTEKAKGTTAKQIALKLGRTEGSINALWTKLKAQEQPK